MDLRKKYGKYCKSGPNCSYVEKRVVWLLSHLRGLGLWPIHRLPGQGLDRILTALDNPSLNQPGMEDLDEGRACEGCKAYSQAPTLEALHLELSTKAADIEAGVKKVCYWCTREGSAWDQECGHEENKPDEASS